MINSKYPFIPSLSYGIGLLLVISMFGCNSSRARPAGFPELHACSLKITQEAEPLVGAIVTLHPQGAPLAWSVAGKTDKTGTATIFTGGYYSGVPAGEYKVTVEKIETVMPSLPDVLPTDERELDKLNEKLAAETKDFRLIEPVYTKEESTPLSLSVETKAAKESFDVGKKYREPANQGKQKKK